MHAHRTHARTHSHSTTYAYAQIGRTQGGAGRAAARSRGERGELQDSGERAASRGDVGQLRAVRGALPGHWDGRSDEARRAFQGACVRVLFYIDPLFVMFLSVVSRSGVCESLNVFLVHTKRSSGVDCMPMPVASWIGCGRRPGPPFLSTNKIDVDRKKNYVWCVVLDRRAKSRDRVGYPPPCSRHATCHTLRTPLILPGHIHAHTQGYRITPFLLVSWPSAVCASTKHVQHLSTNAEPPPVPREPRVLQNALYVEARVYTRFIFIFFCPSADHYE